MKKIFKTLFYILLCIALIMLLGGAWLYSGSTTDLKVKVFKSLKLPVALVNGQPISMSDFDLRFSIAKKLSEASAGNQTNTQIKQLAYNQLIYDTEIVQLATKTQNQPTLAQINAEYNLRANSTSAKGQGDLESLIKFYGMNVDEYKQKIIVPHLASIYLQVWFNNNEQLNQALLAKVTDIEKKIKAGQDFGELALQYSEDKTGQSVEGDMGFLSIDDLLPELRDSIDSMKEGEVKRVAGRFGVHLFKLESKNKNKIHSREIFFKQENFKLWLNQQLFKMHVKKLLNNF